MKEARHKQFHGYEVQEETIFFRVIEIRNCLTHIQVVIRLIISRGNFSEWGKVLYVVLDDGYIVCIIVKTYQNDT